MGFWNNTKSPGLQVEVADSGSKSMLRTTETSKHVEMTSWTFQYVFIRASRGSGRGILTWQKHINKKWSNWKPNLSGDSSWKRTRISQSE